MEPKKAKLCTANSTEKIQIHSGQNIEVLLAWGGGIAQPNTYRKNLYTWTNRAAVDAKAKSTYTEIGNIKALRAVNRKQMGLSAIAST